MIAAAVVTMCVAGVAYAIPGDLDLDGDVDFDDFFAFADNFGMTGPPDTLRVTVFDTLSLETVYDTVTVEFVAAPDSIRTDSPSQLVADWSTGEPLAVLGIQMYGGRAAVKLYSREPIDDDDHPTVSVNYDRIPVAASFLVRYAPFVVDDSLGISAPDTLTLYRDARLLREDAYVWFCCGTVEEDMSAQLDAVRFPDVANTTGSLILDVVLRTPIQGDFAIRGTEQITISSTGKVVF